MQTELKPCPFCGGEIKIMQRNSTKEYYVFCSSFGCPSDQSSWADRTSENHQEAIQAWNNRV